MFKDTGFKYYCGITHPELLGVFFFIISYFHKIFPWFFWQAWIPTWRVRRSCCWKQATRKWWTRSQTPTAPESAPSVQAQPPSSAVQYNAHNLITPEWFTFMATFSSEGWHKKHKKHCFLTHGWSYSVWHSNGFHEVSQGSDSPVMLA